MIHHSKPAKSNPSVRLITRFSGHQICSILQKYWYLLMSDETVSKHINTYLEITFKRSRSPRDKLVHSHHISQVISSREPKGTRPFHKCSFCRYVHSAMTVALPNGHVHRPDFSVTCQSIGIFYIIQCECKAFYIGKTKRPFFYRIRDHVSLISKEKIETPISRHMGIFHHFDSLKLHFSALEHIPPGDRGGDYDKILLQKEAKWIYELSALKYPGLNNAFSFKPFL